MTPPKQPDALATLGTLIGDHERRDAVHIAVMPAVAACPLIPAMNVGFLPDGTVGFCDNPVGIVDPFLKTLVQKGQRFWLFIYPRQITSLRHAWTHPDIPDETEACAVASQASTETKASPLLNGSLRWLEFFASNLGVSFVDLISHATHFLETGRRWCDGDRFEGERVPEEFWSHYEIVTGRTVSEDDRRSFFACSC